MKENIIINYLLLEQILRVTGTYENICDNYLDSLGVIYTEKNKDFDQDKYNANEERFKKDHEEYERGKEKYKEDKEKYIKVLERYEKDKERYNEEDAKNREYIPSEINILRELFKQARTGDINSLLQNDGVKDTTFGIIEELTGVSVKYWSGQERIKLGIRCKNSNLIDYHTKSIDEINLSNDDGTMYKEIMNNPLSLNYEEVYLSTVGLNRAEVDEEVMEQELVIIDSLYSLRGLITVLLINIKDTSDIRLLDRRDIYEPTKWKPYIRELKKPTEHDITYCPKYIEIRKGLVQTIIKNILIAGHISINFKEL